MKPYPALIVALLIALSAFVTPGQARADGPDLYRMNLGSYVTGPQITRDDLKGRFVMVEFWGVNCPPCLSAIPHVTKLAEEYGHKKLLIIASHAQSATDEQCKEVWEARAKSNHVAVVNRGHLPGFNVSGLPASILFDPEGNVVWQGSPTRVDKPLAEAMRRYRPTREATEQEAGPEPIITGIESEYFGREVERINDQKNSFAMPLAKLRNAIERSSRDEQKAEAAAILAAVSDWATSQQRTAESAKAEDPATAYAIAERVIDLLGSDELGAGLLEMKQAIEADDALMDAVRSTTMLREVMAQAQSIGLAEDPAAAKDSKNGRAVRSITRDLRRISKAWPTTEAGQQAEQLLKDWDL